MILFYIFFGLFIYLFLFSSSRGIMLLAVVSFGAGVWCFVVLLCELGTIPPPQGGFVGRAVRARHTAVPDPPH